LSLLAIAESADEIVVMPAGHREEHPRVRLAAREDVVREPVEHLVAQRRGLRLLASRTDRRSRIPSALTEATPAPAPTARTPPPSDGFPFARGVLLGRDDDASRARELPDLARELLRLAVVVAADEQSRLLHALEAIAAVADVECSVFPWRIGICMITRFVSPAVTRSSTRLHRDEVRRVPASTPGAPAAATRRSAA
jgi:hypothetical protein